ncbi:hypothetical protein IIB34_00215 [PVC group bacterium]|nr:hypothetical protein [PVC group bacterium]
MKVYMVGSTYFGCNYVRLALPMMENGWTGSYMGLTKASLKPVKRIRDEMMNADIIVFHRPATVHYHKLGMILKGMGKKIVFDNDDSFNFDDSHLFKNLDEKGFKQNRKKLNNLINNFIINSDLVTTTTEFLAKEYREIHKNVVVLPNCVDPDDWGEPLENKTGKVRIGIVGSVAYHHDFEKIKGLLRKLDARDDVQLVLIGLWNGTKREDNPLVNKVHKKEFKFWDSLKNKEHIPWCDVVYYMESLRQARLDMMLIPRRENHFNKAKSNIKFLEASMLEIPVIAQGFKDGLSPYDNDIDGTNGVLVTDDKKWEEEVMLMIRNPGKRLMLGATAKQYVLNNYQIKDHAYKWAEAYSKL